MADKIVDACSLINLYASGKFKSIIAGFGGDFYLSDQARCECLTIRQPDPTDQSRLIAAPIDLSDAISDGTLKMCHLEGDMEFEEFVAFATQIDDGEASCLAIAKSRNWIVATDDRKAIRLGTEASIQVITTPELIQHWAVSASPSDAEVAEALKNIERFASFRPRQACKLYGWWTARVDLA